MKNYIAAALVGTALALAPFGAMAADTAQQKNVLLAPGAAAGVKKAEDWTWDNNKGAWVLGGAVVVGGLIWILSDNGGHHSTSTTTTGHP